MREAWGCSGGARDRPCRAHRSAAGGAGFYLQRLAFGGKVAGRASGRRVVPVEKLDVVQVLDHDARS